MAKHIVCLPFDFDVMSGHIARGLTTPTPISRGEFGVVGASRILSLLQIQKILVYFLIEVQKIMDYYSGTQTQTNLNLLLQQMHLL